MSRETEWIFPSDKDAEIERLKAELANAKLPSSHDIEMEHRIEVLEEENKRLRDGLRKWFYELLGTADYCPACSTPKYLHRHKPNCWLAKLLEERE